MKTSEVIKALQSMVDTYGDLNFTISMSGDTIITSEEIHFGYDQFEDHDEINVRDFPY